MKKALFSLLALGLCACGAEFEPSSQVSTLRILGIQKDPPYAPPGSTVTLRMLWFDGKAPDEGRKIQRFFSSSLPCHNPPGDLYYACFAGFLGAGSASPPGGLDGGAPALGSLPLEIPVSLLFPDVDESTVAIPPKEEIIRPAPSGGLTPYGLTYIFFGVCSGTMYFKRDLQAGFPVVCKDDAGNYLGADDFVAGYTSIYTYEGISNSNPRISGFVLGGQPRSLAVDGVCVGADCTEPQLHPTPEEWSTTSLPHIAACADDGGKKCPGYPISVSLSQDCPNNCGEPDTLAAQHGDNLTEQVWVRYFSERGKVDSPVRLLNDARRGPNSDFGTKLRAPKSPGPMFVWAVVQDSRGGEEWVRQTIIVD